MASEDGPQVRRVTSVAACRWPLRRPLALLFVASQWRDSRVKLSLHSKQEASYGTRRLKMQPARACLHPNILTIRKKHGHKNRNKPVRYFPSCCRRCHGESFTYLPFLVTAGCPPRICSQTITETSVLMSRTEREYELSMNTPLTASGHFVFISYYNKKCPDPIISGRKDSRRCFWSQSEQFQG